MAPKIRTLSYKLYLSLQCVIAVVAIGLFLLFAIQNLHDLIVTRTDFACSGLGMEDSEAVAWVLEHPDDSRSVAVSGKILQRMRMKDGASEGTKNFNLGLEFAKLHSYNDLSEISTPALLFLDRITTCHLAIDHSKQVYSMRAWMTGHYGYVNFNSLYAALGMCAAMLLFAGLKAWVGWLTNE